MFNAFMPFKAEILVYNIFAPKIYKILTIGTRCQIFIYILPIFLITPHPPFLYTHIDKNKFYFFKESQTVTITPLPKGLPEDGWICFVNMDLIMDQR